MARSTRMLFFIACLLIIFEKPETEDDDVHEERKDEAVEQPVKREEDIPVLDAEGHQGIDNDGRKDHQDEANKGRLCDGPEPDGLDKLVFLFFFRKAHEQGRERCRQVDGQRTELAVRLRDKFQSVE